MTNFIIGTANFTSKYGVADTGKLFSDQELSDLITFAQKNGINHFDSALAYGNSDIILSRYLDKSSEPEIDSKLDKRSCQSKEMIVEATKKTVRRLGINQLSVLYLHDEMLLQSRLSSEISKGLLEVLSLGLVKKIGVSVYSEVALLKCKKAIPELSVFQVPENICDRRLFSSKKVLRLSAEGNTFNVRSIFLQGLLLMEPESLPPQLNDAAPKLRELLQFAEKNSLTRLELCVAYSRSISWASGIVIGVSSLSQLKEILKVSASLPEGWQRDVPRLPIEVIDPRRW